jgi:hypothetical protein
MNHVLSTFLPHENRLYGSLNPEDFAPKTEVNPRKTRNSPQLTTNAEELFYPQLSGRTSAVDLTGCGKVSAFLKGVAYGRKFS